MPQRVETTGKNVEEALQRALAELGAKRDEVRLEVRERGGGRFLGFLGGRPARVLVERLVHRHESVQELVSDLFEVMQIPVTIAVQDLDGEAQVSITTDGLDGLLIGRQGQTLSAFQHVVGRLVSREFGPDARVRVDVGDYRRRRESHLTDKARVLADKVKKTGREINLEPLHAPDRRVVHLALAGMPGVRTYTVGQGLHRLVVIAPDTKTA